MLMERLSHRFARSRVAKIAAGLALLYLGSYTIDPQPFGLHETDNMLTTEATPQPSQAGLIGTAMVGAGVAVIADTLRRMESPSED